MDFLVEEGENLEKHVSEIQRCWWTGTDEIYCQYHDEEWGRPSHDDRHLFEMLCLEGAQAGLSWITILKKRVQYQKLYKGFHPIEVANMTDEELENILLDPGIIRNRLKVYGFRKNAKAFLGVVEEFGSFEKYLWHFVDYQVIINNFSSAHEVPVKTEISDRMAKDLKKRGFTFVGSTICYAYMQAVGLVNDHTTDCYKHHQRLTT
ncbi:MAG: DNA-3-methyladenine glycosylase I [Firmicutes bacterium HGW-Firmicutes-7]|nr:MAG: DNA-3-methyladenine glycosylase I [Firmicutes bacterium HGW-Firmicutes-7]